MISIVDSEQLRNVLRPTVYRPSTARFAESPANPRIGEEAVSRQPMAETAVVR